MTQEQRLESLKKNKNSFHFEKFTTTSVFIVLYSCTGMYGKEAKELAISILREFVQWMRKHKSILYLPTSGMEVMYHPTLIEQLVDWCETLDDKEKNEEEKAALCELLVQKKEEFDQELCRTDWYYFIMKRFFSNIYYIGEDEERYIILGGIIVGAVIGFGAAEWVKRW